MRFWLKICFLSVLVITVSDANAGWKVGNRNECYYSTSGKNVYYFCGQQAASCNGSSASSRVQNWYFHNESFAHDGYWYLCCDGTKSKEGKFKVVKERWETKIATEYFPDGKCSWEQRVSMCGDVLNPEDKCTEPVPCEAGQVWHQSAKRCVTPCTEGYAYESVTSPVCIPCPETASSTVSDKGVCTKCDSDALYDRVKNMCVSKSQYLLATTHDAHDLCWLCPTPGTLYHCLKMVSQSGNLNGDNTLKTICSVSGVEALADNADKILNDYPLPTVNKKIIAVSGLSPEAQAAMKKMKR